MFAASFVTVPQAHVVQIVAAKPDNNFGWLALLMLGVFVACLWLKGYLESYRHILIRRFLASIPFVGAVLSPVAAAILGLMWIVNMK